MSHFIEALTSKFGKFPKEHIRIQVLEPASEEKQRMLEEGCYEVLEHEAFSGEDLLRFTVSMIELIGGTLEQPERQVTIKQSNPLDDLQNGVSISFQYKASAEYIPIEYAIITAKSSTISEQLEFGTSNNRRRKGVTYGPVMISQISIDNSPSFKSYISGSQEAIFPDGTATYQRSVDFSTEVKPFCEKVFGIYQQRGK